MSKLLLKSKHEARTRQWKKDTGNRMKWKHISDHKCWVDYNEQRKIAVVYR